MPFWTYFWLIVPAVTLLAVATFFYVRGGRNANGPHPSPPEHDHPGGRR